MNTKVVLAALAASVAAFLLGWGIFGIALHSYSEAAMNKFEGFMKAEENWSWLSLIAANVAYGCMMAFIMWRMGITSAKAALLPGFIIGLLLTANFDLMMHAMSNLFYERMFIVVDAIAGGVLAALTAAVAGLVLGSGSKAS
ncbi:MAG: hypothetical protein IPF41_09260 [Flavobacteriales bacterium]|nr:hypothetical protein [Flavobacteriales bacterium]